MIEERRWPLGNKTTELHGGGGLITTVKWKDTLIAWANSTAKVPRVVHVSAFVIPCSQGMKCIYMHGCMSKGM